MLKSDTLENQRTSARRSLEKRRLTNATVWVIKGSRRQKQHRENLYTITSMSALFIVQWKKKRTKAIASNQDGFVKTIVYLELKWKFICTVTSRKVSGRWADNYSITGGSVIFFRGTFLSSPQDFSRARKIACSFNSNYSLSRFDSLSKFWSTIYSKISTMLFFVLLFCEES